MVNLESEYHAHSPNESGDVDFVSAHLKKVAERASEYASAFDVSTEARITGLLHDLGKYGQLFQRRLEGKERGVDHWSIGAWAALTNYKFHGIAAALAIQGHHIGLQRCDKNSLRELDPQMLNSCHPLGLRLSDNAADIAVFLDRLKDDGLVLPEALLNSIFSFDTRDQIPASAMLDIRMLFSTLVDADFIETEAHFQANPDGSKNYRKSGQRLEPDRAVLILNAYIDRLIEISHASKKVNRLRQDLLAACREKANATPGQFTLTAPTGAGKTLSMLSFALEHAKIHHLRRIVIVIPYLSIIEQTAQEYKNIFSESLGIDFILEHHSLARSHEGRAETDDKTACQHRLLSENWNAPVIVTTSVQFLESLFSNRPSSCRKLHSLAKSVILFDEVQTLPVHSIIPTLATLSRLTERFGSTVVFSTATQPAFSHLDESVKKYCMEGWKPLEIVPSDLKLFERVRRTKVNWPGLDERVSWADLSKRMVENEQALCIVNLKSHARTLFEELSELKTNGLFHLSTNMCPAHRRNVLDNVRDNLRQGKSCRLVSTQCVEAGVDLDFPAVYRALGPLDAIAQAAGRCNRNGLHSVGEVTVIIPDVDNPYPPGIYRQAANVTRILLNQFGSSNMDINDPLLFEKYFLELYEFSTPDKQNKKLNDAISSLDFVETAKHYRVIDRNAINVVVPYDLDLYMQLQRGAEHSGLTRKWIAEARPYTIGMYKPKDDNIVLGYLLPVTVRNRKTDSSDWYIYTEPDHYDLFTGLVPPSDECLIA